HQMKSAQSFDRDDFPLTNRPGGGEQGVVAALVKARISRVFTNAAAWPKLQLRPAGRTRVRLRVKAAVARVVVFRLALRAHCELFHRCVRAVVGQGLDDAEAWAAIRAIDERITMATVPGIENFTKTIRTGGDVRQHERGLVAAGFAGADFKILEAGRIQPRGFEALDETARRFFGFEPQKKLFQRGARAFNFDENAL